MFQEKASSKLFKNARGYCCKRATSRRQKASLHDSIQIDTSQILFICGGAFVGLDDVVQKRLGKNSIGFIPNENRARTKSNRDRVGADLINDLEPDDLVKYGLIPEFIGRMPVSAILEPLNAKALESILTEPRDALVKQFRTLLSMDNVELSFDEDAVEAIAQEAYKRKTGARALRGIVEEIMLDLMYSLPSQTKIKNFNVTKKMVDEITGGKVVPLLSNEKRIVKESA